MTSPRVTNSLPGLADLSRPNRRTILALGGSLAVAAAEASPRTAEGAGGEGKPVDVILAEGTNLAVAASPDGRRIALDLLGLLWIVPAEGGRATCLTDAFADLAQPCWAPDGSRIAFQSYRDGHFHICTIGPDGTGFRQLTSGSADHREPAFAPDGRSIIFSSDRLGRYAIFRLDLGDGTIVRISPGGGEQSEPCFHPSGRRFAYVEDGRRIMVGDFEGRADARVSVERSGDLYRWSQLYGPCFAPDGALSYVRHVDGHLSLLVGEEAVVSGEDIYPFRSTWMPNGDLVYGSTGRIWRTGNRAKRPIDFTAGVAVSPPSYRRRPRDFTPGLTRPVTGIGSPRLSPDGTHVAFEALNDLYLLKIGDPTPKRLTSGGFHKCGPAWSPDGRALVYSTDRGGTFDLWIHDLGSGQDRQLSHLSSGAALSANWSQDGEWICFLNQDGELHLLDVATGAIRQIYDALWQPGRPSFSPDGRTIACAAFRPASGRFRDGLSEILTVDVATSRGTYRPIAPNRSIATRGDDGPVWSPDGKYMAYVFASTLWLQPVDRTGEFDGPPRQITAETSDAPSWSGNGETLLYLNNGRLKVVPASGGEAGILPFAMNWAMPRSVERRLVSGARVWDGLSRGYSEADVLLEGGRIGALIPSGRATGEDLARIEGTGCVLLPGLVDMHTHRQMQGYGFGDRMGRILLAMGITSTRSPGGPAYHMAEDREAIDAGRRIAPRHFSCGEALDGSRIYYNFMRPVTEPGQLELEMQRAEALSYDLLKTYVRLGHREQARVIEAGHRLGISSSSHYHYPALRNGMDGVEHLGSTSRYGYSRTATLLGSGYADVMALFAAARAGRTPTLFSAQVLMAEDPALVDDERITRLYPSWEYVRLRQRYEAIRQADRTAPLELLRRNVEQVREMMRLGWHVHSGTDAPIDFLGISLHLNLRALTRFGTSPHDALLTATRHAGEFLDAPLGTIAPGKLADLILVRGDPLARIEDVANVKATIVAGVPHSPQSLIAPFAFATPAIGPSPIERRAERDERYFWQEAAYVELGRHSCCGGHTLPA